MTIATVAAITLAGSAIGSPSGHVIDLTRPVVTKDLTRSALGADAEDFCINGVEFANLLGPRRHEFARHLREGGVKVLRFATMLRYDFAGADATLKLARLTTGADDMEALWYEWFDPELFFSFCRENDINIIAMVNLPLFYDVDTDRALDGLLFPEACARNAARFVQWVADHDYADTVVAWELGNETYGYSRKCEPEVLARLNAVCARAMKAVDPGIKIAVPGVAMGAGWKGATTEEGRGYQELTEFSARTLAALGRDARLIDYLILHLYGQNEAYNASGFGPVNFHRDLIAPNPNCRHMRFIVTEWRYVAHPTTGDQTFLWGALHHGKVTADLLADPRVDWIAGIHSLNMLGGLLFVSNGEIWHLWEPENVRIPDPLRKPRMALGPYAVVLRWLNEAVERCPLLVGTGDTGGGGSQARDCGRLTTRSAEGSSGSPR